MLSEIEELQPIFLNPLTGSSKEIDCIRVDGASDEGPSHELVQYWWTEWHYRKKKVATIVTSRSSGSSYLNRVELQNGCLALGHSNTFIPSTLNGSCIDPDTGNIDEQKLKVNLQLAIDAYIDRVDRCPMGDTCIKLYEGSTSNEYHSLTGKLNIFIKGSKKQKAELQKADPDLYAKFNKIWAIRGWHMVKGLPPSYVFFLKCCYQPECDHPVCQSSHDSGNTCQPLSTSHWYANGPSLSVIPLPVADQSRPWGGNSCQFCSGFCCGHYESCMIPIQNNKVNGFYSSLPSAILKNMISNCADPLAEEFLMNAGKTVLLSVDDTRIWIQHLLSVIQSRKRGAVKAATTRKNKRVSTQRPDEDSCHSKNTESENGRQMNSENGRQVNSENSRQVNGENGRQVNSENGHQVNDENGRQVNGENGRQLNGENGHQVNDENGRQVNGENGRQVNGENDRQVNGENGRQVNGEDGRQVNGESGRQVQLKNVENENAGHQNSGTESENGCQNMESEIQKKESDDNFCGSCGTEYPDELLEDEFWIACDLCNKWFCCKCEGLILPPSDNERYFCKSCCT